jgi:hypothetical protein
METGKFTLFNWYGCSDENGVGQLQKKLFIVNLNDIDTRTGAEIA